MKKFISSIQTGVIPTTKKILITWRGQSNQNVRGLAANVPANLIDPIPNCFIWLDGAFEPVVTGMVTNDPVGDFCNLINFAYLLNQAFPTQEFYFDFWCVGGTPISYWSAPSGVGWLAGLAQHNEIIGGNPQDWDLTAFGWLQGETDGITEIVADAYEANEIQLFTDYALNYGFTPSTKTITANIGDVIAAIPFAETVRQAKVTNFANNIYTHYFDNFDLPLLPDGQHFTIDSQVIIGQRYFDAYTS